MLTLVCAGLAWGAGAGAQETDAGEITAETSAEAGPDFFDKDEYRLTPIVCPFKGEVDYKPEEISCGLLEVPENREKARPRRIQLHFAKIAARQPEDWDADEDGEWIKRDDPIIYLTGGPGVQAQGYVDRLKDHGVRDFRDLYILEQRGIGWSGDFCPLYTNLDPAAANTPDWDQYQRAGLDAIEACFAAAKAAKVDLTGYSTIENARDVKALRTALGHEQWNVWGISYGSILGQAYLKADPEGVRAAVIDAIVPLSQDISFHNIARHYDRDLTLLAEACAADATCAAQLNDFKPRLEAAIRKTAMAPIEVDAIDTELFPSGKAYLFQDLVGGAPFTMFYEQDNYAALPAFIDAFVRLIEEDRHEPFRILTAGTGGGGVDISPGMYNAISCLDNWAPAMEKSYREDFADYPALAMIFGDPSIAAELGKICKRYGLAPRPAEDYAAVETDIRTLIVEGAMDPITPPPLAEMILPGFSNGTYVEFPYAGHGPSRSVECAGSMLTGFFDDPNGELDLSCVETMTAPKFHRRLFETGAITRLISLAVEDPKKVAAPAIWLGAPMLIFALGLVIFTLSPIARLINRGGAQSAGGVRLIGWLTALVGAASAAGLGYGIYASNEASQFLLLVGLLDWARWFVVAGLGAGALGGFLVWRTVAERMRTALPIGTLIGLLATGFAGLAWASGLLANGFAPF